jgi:hypothetical protein
MARIFSVACLLVVACATTRPPRVSGARLQPSTAIQRVAVAPADRDAFVEGVESALIEHGQGRFSVMARHEQAAMMREKKLQYSGDFSDESLVGLGRQLGAELLFVITDEVNDLPKKRPDPRLKNCNSGNEVDGKDTSDERSAKHERRRQCEEDNKERVARAEQDFEQQPAKKRYRLWLRAVDLNAGSMIANADAEVDEGDLGTDCDLRCIQERAASQAVRHILGVDLQAKN